MGKIFEYGKDARQKVLDGVEKLAKTVRVTMGPKGRNVIVGRTIGAPTITKDGVSVAREVVLDDPIEELGCQLVKEAAGRTASLAGDGTTTATVLTHSIFKEGLDLINSGYSPLDFRDGVIWAKNAVVDQLSELSHSIDDDKSLIDVATISANNDSVLGNVIAGAYIAVGRDGAVTAEAHPNVPHSFRVVDGVELQSGYISHHFLEKNCSKRDMKNSLIFICDEELTSFMDEDIGRVIKRIADLKKDVLFLCNDVKKEALASLIQNFNAGRLKVCAVKIPRFGAHQEKWLEDLSMLTGATIVGGDRGIPWSDFKVSHLGYADSIVIDSYQTKIINPRKDDVRISERIRLYEEFLKRLVSDSDRQSTHSRLGFLRGKVAVITVGYSTELELREVGDRVEDAMFAVKAAIDEGYVIGGGFALWRASSVAEQLMHKELSESKHKAAMVILEACKEPARQIIRNAHLNPSDILVDLGEDYSVGYNAATCEYGNLFEMGVIDPKKVTRTALENAVSIAQLLLTTDAVIADNPYNESGWQPPAGYRMPKDGGLNHKY